MKSNFVVQFALLALLAILYSCVAPRTVRSPSLNMNQFDSIELRQTQGDVIRLLGSPSERVTSKTKPGSDVLIYNDVNFEDRQIAAIEIERLSHLVIGITLIPRETDQERSLEFLLKSKFAGIEFEKFSRSQCGVDYDRRQTYFINVDKGLAIEQETGSKDITRLFKLSIPEARSFKKLITRCEN